MTYRIIKDGPSFLIALDSLDDPPLSIVERNEPTFMTLDAAVKRRNQLEDEIVAAAANPNTWANSDIHEKIEKAGLYDSHENPAA